MIIRWKSSLELTVLHPFIGFTTGYSAVFRMAEITKSSLKFGNHVYEIRWFRNLVRCCPQCRTPRLQLNKFLQLNHENTFPSVSFLVALLRDSALIFTLTTSCCSSCSTPLWHSDELWIDTHLVCTRVCVRKEWFHFAGKGLVPPS